MARRTGGKASVGIVMPAGCRGRRPGKITVGLPKATACLLVVAALLGGCKGENKYVPPPPPQVGVAQPLQQAVRAYLENTGNTQAFNTVDLVARVKGFLSEIDYQDGATAKRGTTLFVIEPATYQAQLQQAQAQLIIAKAKLVQSQAEFDRQSKLFSQNVTAQATLDQARAKRDSDQGAVLNADGDVTLAALNLGYTHVAAPFDGIVTRHLVSAGELVGGDSATKLATIVQLDPIYVMFNVSEQDALRVRENLRQRRLTLAEIDKVPIEVGLMDETGYPHKGFLDYVAPGLDPATGTILVRAIFQNSDRGLLPGFFVRIRVPMGQEPVNALLVPDRVLGQSQEGRYVLVLNKDDVVEQRSVKVGQQVGDLRVIESGLEPDDRVIVTGAGRAIPGRKAAPEAATIAAAPADTATATK